MIEVTHSIDFKGHPSFVGIGNNGHFLPLALYGKLIFINFVTGDMMTARKVLFSLVSMIILFCGVVEGSTQNVISTQNEFGGKTVEEVYSPEDKESGDIIKIISYYNDSNRSVKREYFFTDRSANKDGVSRSIVYLDSNEKVTKTEVFYTDKSANEDGISRGIVYSDSNGKATRAKTFYTDEFANKNGFNRKHEYLDSSGKTIKTDLYMHDRLLKLIRTYLKIDIS